MIFVDTSAWFAAVVSTDPNHERAAAFLALNRVALVTTDYVVDETLTLLRVRGARERALTLGAHFFAGKLIEVYYLTPADVRQTWLVYRDYQDKDWNFTDCASRVVMAKLGITSAFAFDKHFRQFGTVAIVP